MKITHSALFAALLCIAAAPAAATPSLQGGLGPQVVLDDLNILLLYGARTGAALDPLGLVEMTDGRSSPDMQEALARYRQAQNARERFERKALIEYALKERRDRLSEDFLMYFRWRPPSVLSMRRAACFRCSCGSMPRAGIASPASNASRPTGSAV